MKNKKLTLGPSNVKAVPNELFYISFLLNGTTISAMPFFCFLGVTLYFFFVALSMRATLYNTFSPIFKASVKSPRAKVVFERMTLYASKTSSTLYAQD